MQLDKFGKTSANALTSHGDKAYFAQFEFSDAELLAQFDFLILFISDFCFNFSLHCCSSLDKQAKLLEDEHAHTLHFGSCIIRSTNDVDVEAQGESICNINVLLSADAASSAQGLQ